MVGYRNQSMCICLAHSQNLHLDFFSFFFETKLKAESKVSRMSLKIGYPDYILNTDELNQKYKDLEILPDRYFENILNVLRYLTRSEQSKFRFEMIKSIFFHHFH